MVAGAEAVGAVVFSVAVVGAEVDGTVVCEVLGEVQAPKPKIATVLTLIPCRNSFNNCIFFVLFVVKRYFADKTHHEVFEHFKLTSKCTRVHLSKVMLLTTLLIKGNNKSNPVN